MAPNPSPSERFAARLALAGVAALCLVAMCHRVDDRDIWLHLRTGRLMVETASVPRTDPYSYTATGRPWVYPSWLAAVLMHACHACAGLPGVQALAALANLGALLVLLRAMRRGRVTPLTQVVVAVLLLRVMELRSAPRPYVFTHLCLAWFVTALDRYHRTQRPPYELIPLMALWANLHPGFVAGLLLVACHGLAAGVTQWRTGRGLPWKFWLLCAAVAAATVANPYGLRALTHPFRVTGIGPVLGSVSEWQRLGLQPGTGPFWLYMGVAAAGVGFCLRRRTLALDRVLPAAVFAALAFTAVRHVAVCALVCAPLLASGLDAALGRRRRQTVPLLAALALVAMLGAGAVASGRGRFGLEPRCHPVGGVEFALRAGIRGRLFNEFGKGAYILWRAWPGYEVFIDGRLSVFGRRINDDWRKITWMLTGWRGLLERYRIDFILGDNRLNKRYYSLPGWRLVYWDDVSRILVKPTPDRRALIERYECGLTCPDTFSPMSLKRHGLLPQAVAQLEAKVQADAGCVVAHVNLGRCYLLQKRYDAAVGQFRLVLDPERNDAELCQYLADALAGSGQGDEAAVYSRRADWLRRLRGSARR